MVYSILYISSPTRSRVAPLMGCRLSSIIKANGYQRSFCMAVSAQSYWTWQAPKIVSWWTLQSALFSQRQICSVHLYPAFGSFHWQIPKSESVEYFLSMMRSEHHTGMHSFHNILISKSALVFLEQLQGETPFLISHCIHDADSSIYLCWMACADQKHKERKSSLFQIFGWLNTLWINDNVSITLLTMHCAQDPSPSYSGSSTLSILKHPDFSLSPPSHWKQL